MSTPRFLAISLVACCFSTLLATTALGQYMYLDSNGNGVNDSGDAVNGTGVPTTVDLYIITNRNRDGSEAPCPLVEPYHTSSLLSYSVNLLAVDGTVTYSNYINRQADRLGIRYNEFNPDGVRYQTGFAGSVRELWLPPGGPYLMATLTVTAQTGSPRIDIVVYVTGALDQTFMALDCSNRNNDVLFLLGLDWSDVDGLRSGGTALNRPPVLSPPTDMVVDVGEFATQEVSATDPDLQSLSLTLPGAPQFALLTTESSESGVARGVIHLSPRSADVGIHSMTLAVTDGALEDQRSFIVTVQSGINHPPTLAPVPPIAVAAGRVRREEIFAGDPDGGLLQLTKLAGPTFTSFRQLRSEEGGAVGELRVAPSLCETGSGTILIAASDGVVDTRMEILVQVMPLRDPPSLLRMPFEAGGQIASDVALTDLDRDGNLDAVVSFEFSNEVSVLLGNGQGGLALRQKVSSGPGAWSLDTADFNEDGSADVVVANSSSASVSVLLGNGDGTLQPGVATPVGPGPHGLRVSDLNSDGRTDIVVSNQSGGTLTVLLGRGDGTFQTRMDTKVGSFPEDCVVADFDGDGRPDVAVTVLGGRTITTLLGTGSGALRPGTVLPLLHSPHRAAAGDWDWNGVPDLAVSNLGANTLQIYRGDAAGGFALWSESGPYYFPATVDAADFDQDGETDLALMESSIEGLDLFRGLPGGGFALPPLRLGPGEASNYDTGDMNGDGLRDFVLVFGTSGLVVLNGGVGSPPIGARGFLAADHRTVPDAQAGSRITLQLEPVNESFAPTELDPATVRLSRSDSDSPLEIAPLLDKTITVSDTDRNGVPEIALPFARANWANLFEDIRGRETVGLGLEGSLVNGRRLCARFPVTVVGTGSSAAPEERPKTFKVAVAPNPLNPAGVIRFSTTREGFARIRICDVRGRVVRSLLDATSVPAGDHEKPFDGRSDNGESLASGVYFYHLETREGTLRGRITVLK